MEYNVVADIFASSNVYSDIFGTAFYWFTFYYLDNLDSTIIATILGLISVKCKALYEILNTIVPIYAND